MGIPFIKRFETSRLRLTASRRGLRTLFFGKKCAIISPPPPKKKNRDVIINIINYLKVVFSCLSFVRHLPNI